LESGGERPTFQPVKEFSPYLSNALKESGVRFEELLFAQHELIIATSVETAELLTVDSDLHRKKINELINQVVAEKATPFDPDGKSNDIDIELYSVLTDLGKKEQLEQFSVWEWYILERTSFEVVEHLTSRFRRQRIMLAR